MQLVKLSIRDRVMRAAHNNHGLRLNNVSARELQGLVELTHAMTPRMGRAIAKNQGLRLDPHTVKDFQRILEAQATKPAAANDSVPAGT